MKSLKGVLYLLGSQLDHLENRFLLGYHWPITDGTDVKEKWLFYNYAELTTEFKKYKTSDTPFDFKSSRVQLRLVNPITGTFGTRFVTPEFYEWVNNQYANSSEFSIKKLGYIA